MLLFKKDLVIRVLAFLFLGISMAGCTYTNVSPLDLIKAPRNPQTPDALITTVECGPTTQAAWTNTMTDLWGSIFGTKKAGRTFFVKHAAVLGVQTTVVVGGITQLGKGLKTRRTPAPLCFFGGTSRPAIESHSEALGFRIRANAVRLFATPPANMIELWRKYLWGRALVADLSGTHTIIAALGGQDQNADFLMIAQHTVQELRKPLSVSFSYQTPQTVIAQTEPLLKKLGLIVRPPGAHTTFVLDGLLRTNSNGVEQSSLIFRDTAEHQTLVVWAGLVRRTSNLRKIFGKLLLNALETIPQNTNL